MANPVQSNAEYDIYKVTSDVGYCYGSSLGDIVRLPSGELALYTYKSTGYNVYGHWSRKSKIVELFSSDGGKTFGNEADIYNPGDTHVQCPAGVAKVGNKYILTNAEDNAGDDEEGYGSAISVFESATGKAPWTRRVVRDFDAAEDFDGSETGIAYTEVDPNSRLTLGKYRVTASGAGRNETAHIKYDYGASIVRGGIYDVTMLIASTSQVGACAYCGMSNTSGSVNSWGTSDLKVWVEKTGASSYTLNLGRSTTTQSVGISADTPYYCTIERKGNPVLDTVKLYIYSDAARTQLLTTLTVTGFSTTAFRYVYAFATHNSGASGQAFDGYIENLQMNTYWMVTAEFKEIESGIWAVPVHGWMSYNEYIGAATFIKPYRISMLYYTAATDTWSQPQTVIETAASPSILEPSLEIIEQGVSAIMLIRSQESYVLQSQGTKSGGVWSWSAPASTGISAASSQVRVKKYGDNLHLIITNRTTKKLERRVRTVAQIWGNASGWSAASIFNICDFTTLGYGSNPFVGYQMPYLPTGYTDPVIAFISGPYDLITQEVFVAVPKSAPTAPVLSKPTLTRTASNIESVSTITNYVAETDTVGAFYRDSTADTQGGTIKPDTPGQTMWKPMTLI